MTGGAEVITVPQAIRRAQARIELARSDLEVFARIFTRRIASQSLTPAQAQELDALVCALFTATNNLRTWCDE